MWTDALKKENLTDDEIRSIIFKEMVRRAKESLIVLDIAGRVGKLSKEQLKKDRRFCNGVIKFLSPYIIR
tara:strand:+ start:20347 stop:20556 length:210 start_codon:yes stop_codon:yes gene_type:complete